MGFVVSPVAADHGGVHIQENSSDDGSSGTDNWNKPEGGIICGNSEGAERAQDILRAVISIFMLFGFVFAILMYAADRFEDTLGEDVLGDLDGPKSAKKAVTLIVLVYFVDLISEPLFGFNISCIVPQLF